MTLKILPQLVLKTIKEFRNVFIGKNNRDNTQTPDSIGCNIYKYKSQNPESESNETNTKSYQPYKLLPITLTIIPVILTIHCEPQKPPPMRYTELPIYDSPHSNYNENQENVHKCKEFKHKIVQRAILPYVKRYRCIVCDIFNEVDEWFNWIKCQITIAFETYTLSTKKFLSYMRDNKNLDLRKAVVAFGTATGFVFGSRNYYLLRNLSFGVLAALFTGWLCFPKETDKIIRNCSHYIGTNIVYFINYFCGGDRDKIKLEKRNPLLPCLKDVCEPTVYSQKRLICKRHIEGLSKEDLTTLKVMEKQKILEEQLTENLSEEEDKCLIDDTKGNH